MIAPPKTEGASRIHQLGPTDEDLYKCVHCGLCLNYCPTYLETGQETESPRGRIALMKAVREERVGLTSRVVSHMELCLQCRACEAVCPSGVPFGKLMEATRAQISAQRKAPLPRRIALNLALHHLLPHPRRLRIVGKVLRMYQRSLLAKLGRRLPGRLGHLERQLPPLPERFFQPEAEVMRPMGEVRARVGLLSGCVMPLTQGPTMEAAVRVLLRNGCEVVLPKGQICCGALNVHGGDRAQAQSMARRNIDAFLDAGVDAVVVASAGCGSTMKEYRDHLEGDSAYREKAREFSDLVKDISEFLAELPLVPPERPLNIRVTYQDACHLAHAQRITQQPRDLLRSIPGVEVVEMENPSRCCGAAGLYTTLQPEMSQQLMKRKIEAVLDTEAEVVVSGNPGCMIQLQMGLRRVESAILVRHVVDLLDQAYQQDEATQ